jgi:predicted ATPase
MRLDKLWIKDFKNLKDFEIDFDEDQMTSVLIGHNGMGKSNLIEAIVIIFRDLDLGNHPSFAYELTYICKGYKIQIKADPEKNQNRTSITVDDKNISFSKFAKDPKRTYLPKYVFAYYSGPGNRLEHHFDKHQDKFYKDLLNDIDDSLRPLFYARLIHSQFVLLSYFSFMDEDAKNFLKEYLGIVELESILFVLKKPTWAWRNKKGDKRFWGSVGVVSRFLAELYDCSLAPICPYTEKNDEECIYLFVQDENKLKKLAEKYLNNKNFFKVLESTYISDLIDEIKIKVKIEDIDYSLTFNELSEGEQQLLTVLGLLKFTRDEESLFLLDEPDTHLNPAWKYSFLDLIEKVVGENATSHVLICTHDPLVIGGLVRSQVKIFEKDESLKIVTKSPEIDPKGMGVAALLTSELYGLSTTIDIETQLKLDKKRELYLKSLENELSQTELNEMRRLTDELGSLDFTRTVRDPLYDKFVKAMFSVEEFRKPVLTPEEIKEQEAIAQQIIEEILEEERDEARKS